MLVNRRFIIIAVIVSILAVATILIASILANQRTITVRTDHTPVKLELNDSTYSINEKERVIAASPQPYTYRVTATIDGKKFVLINKIDLTQLKNATINLDFSIYSIDSISDVLCKNSNEKCNFAPEYLSVVYKENYAWAIVSINNPQIGRAKAVLNVENGKWKVIDGPGTDIEASGYYPQSVEEAIQNEQ